MFYKGYELYDGNVKILMPAEYVKLEKADVKNGEVVEVIEDEKDIEIVNVEPRPRKRGRKPKHQPGVLEIESQPIEEKVRTLEDVSVADYTWISPEHDVVVSVTRGSQSLTEDEIGTRIQEYYSIYNEEMVRFDVQELSRVQIHGNRLGMLKYKAEMMNYKLYNEFILGSYKGKELVVVLQCMAADRKDKEDIMDSIVGSLIIKDSKNN